MRDVIDGIIGAIFWGAMIFAGVMMALVSQVWFWFMVIAVLLWVYL